MSVSISSSHLGSSNVMPAVELPAPARSASRLELLLNLVASFPSDSRQTDEILAVISQSGLLAHVPQDETQHKLTIRITALISSQNAFGYQLAHLWIQQDPAVWNDHLVSNAATWATQIVNLLSAPDKLLLQRLQSDLLLAAALQFAVSHLFPENIASRQEFYRQVVHPNLPKVIIGLTQLLESIAAKQDAEGHAAFATQLHTVLLFTNRFLHAHPAQFRPVSSRILECVTAMLYRDHAASLPLPIFNAAAAVLSSLHLTGALAAKGSEASGGSSRTTQSQLWQATIDNQIRLASEAWRHATSSYQITDLTPSSSNSQASTANKHLGPYPTDPLAATKVAHTRLALLLGSRGRSGLINLHLRAATSRPVPVPVGQLVTLALDMLRLDIASRFKPTAEAKVCSLQASHLHTLQTRAFALVAQLAITAPAAMSLEATRVLGDICRIAEANVNTAAPDTASSRVKLAAMRTLSVLVGRQGVALPLDPAGRVTLRLARLAVTQVARAVIQPAQAPFGAGMGETRKSKKARLYESDSMFAANTSLKDRIRDLSVEEIASTQASLQILVAVYPYLTTSLSAVHYDQMQLTVQIVLALVECLVDSISTHSATLRSKSAGTGAPTMQELLQDSVEALADLCLDSTSSTLALVLPRAIPVLSRIAYAPSGAGSVTVRSVAERALMAVHASRKGKFVPVARGVGFGPRAADDLEAAPEGAKLGGASDVGHAIPVTSEALGSSIVNSSTAVLGGSRESAFEEGDDAAEGVEDAAETRMDVDAITAESAELFKSTGSDAATFAAATTATGLGLGLPTSPRRSPIEKHVLSPDPVKPAHRPSTPRIGSPSTAHPAALSRTGSPTSDAANLGHSGAFLSPGRLSASSAAVAALPAITDAAVEAAAEVVETPAVADAVQEIIDDAPAAGGAAAVETGGVGGGQERLFTGGSSDDDDDEDMPEIDMGDSDDDEEDAGEGEGEAES
ncbi:Pre-rRNA-processing protein RIX1 [Pseudozyma hubeiensis]|nr:Pre-rRNA-processing protein RIX1 [Pseudozyma hubeiensis]